MPEKPVKDNTAPVFIIGGSRTGSEMLKTMLSASPALDFVDELFLLCPRWLHRDLGTSIRNHLGSFDGENAADRLVELLYSGIPYGWFFSVGIHELDRELLKRLLSHAPIRLKSVLHALMLAHAQARSKQGIGAKFPVHYSYYKHLLDWYPDCRLIHTTRHPKGIYVSQAAKHIRDDMGLFAKWFMRFRQFVHINLQISWTAHVHRRLMHLPNYCLVRYEDVVNEPEAQLRRICEFLNVEFVPKMVDPHQYGSSFGQIGSGTGVDPSSLDRWKTSLHPVCAKAIDVLHPKAMRTFGYDL